jgi:DNA polymerase-3 subunit alpha
MLLAKLKCEDYITLVAASSIIRPGVSQSGMMRTYIERHHSNGNYESIHPIMDELMKETYGVMVYQEDVIRVAHHFGGLTLSEADILRRGMSGKYRSRSEFEKVENQFFKNCRERGYDEKVIQRVWYEISSFSGFSFAKGHSASFAVESYESLFLKAHYPIEFMVGVINNFGGFYKTEFYIHEARKAGAEIINPCVNKSNYLTRVEGRKIYLGFIHIKELEQKIGERISIEREERGNYKNIEDFKLRIPIKKEQIFILIKIGAFNTFNKPNKHLLWKAYSLYMKRKETVNSNLFEEEPINYHLPEMETTSLEKAFNELMILEYPICNPFLLINTNIKPDTFANELKDKINKKVHLIGYMVTIKRTSTKNGETMYFGTFHDSFENTFDTVHFPKISLQYPFRGKGFYSIKGKVVLDFTYPMVEVESMEKQGWLNPDYG